MRIIIEYQKLCYSLFHSARLLPTRSFREDAQYKSPGHYANLPNDTVPILVPWGTKERFGSSSRTISVRITFGTYLVSAHSSCQWHFAIISTFLLQIVLYRLFEYRILFISARCFLAGKLVCNPWHTQLYQNERAFSVSEELFANTSQRLIYRKSRNKRDACLNLGNSRSIIRS